MANLSTLEDETYLTFQLEDEIFAVDVLNVHEVLEFKSVTKIPGVPDFMRGIINLRGSVVPVVDLRMKFGMAEVVKTQNTCIIVLNIGTGENQTIIGSLADSVKEVLEFESLLTSCLFDVFSLVKYISSSHCINNITLMILYINFPSIRDKYQVSSFVTANI